MAVEMSIANIIPPSIAQPWLIEGDTWLARNTFVFERRLYSDCTLHISDEENQRNIQEYRIHKLTLAAASPVFDRMFFGPMSVKSEALKLIETCTDVFHLFLEFAYTSTLNFSNCSDESKISLIKLAHKYLALDLVDLCGEALRPNRQIDKVCVPLNVALQFDMAKLRDECISLIQEFSEEFFSSLSFELLSAEALYFILQQDQLKISSELVVYKNVVRWARALEVRETATESEITDTTNLSSLRSIFERNDLFRFIRFLALTPQQFVDEVAPDKILNIAEIRNILMAMNTGRKNKIPANFSKSSNNRIPRIFWIDAAAAPAYVKMVEKFSFEYPMWFQLLPNTKIEETFQIVSKKSVVIESIFVPPKQKRKIIISEVYDEDFTVELHKILAEGDKLIAMRRFRGKHRYFVDVECHLVYAFNNESGLLKLGDKIKVTLQFVRGALYSGGFSRCPSTDDCFIVSRRSKGLITGFVYKQEI